MLITNIYIEVVKITVSRLMNFSSNVQLHWTNIIPFHNNTTNTNKYTTQATLMLHL